MPNKVTSMGLIKFSDFSLDADRAYYCCYSKDFIPAYFELKTKHEKPLFISIKVAEKDFDAFIKEVRLLHNDTINIVPEGLSPKLYKKALTTLTTNPSIVVNVYLINMLLFKFKELQDCLSAEEALYCNDRCFMKSIKNCRWMYLKTLFYPFLNDKDVQKGISGLCKIYKDLSVRLSTHILNLYSSPLYKCIEKRLSNKTLLPIAGYFDPYNIFG